MSKLTKVQKSYKKLTKELKKPRPKAKFKMGDKVYVWDNVKGRIALRPRWEDAWINDGKHGDNELVKGKYNYQVTIKGGNKTIPEKSIRKTKKI